MTNRIGVTNYIAFALITVASTGAIAAAPNFQITEVFSNGDGSIQFIELTQTAGFSDEQHFAGLTLTMTHNGIVKKYTFPHDLRRIKARACCLRPLRARHLRIPIKRDMPSRTLSFRSDSWPPTAERSTSPMPTKSPTQSCRRTERRPCTATGSVAHL